MVKEKPMNDFLKNLNEALTGKIYIENAVDQFSSYYKQKIEIDKFKQYVCTPTKELVTIGPGLILDYPDEYDREFGILHINKLTEMILEFSKRIKFHPLILPSSCIQATLYRHKNIYGRFIKDYVPASDIILERFDFLVQKLD